MNKPTIRQRLKKVFIEPRQVMLLDSHGGKQTRNIKIRPISIILIFLATFLVAFILGQRLSLGNNIQSLVPQHIQLQRHYDQLRSELAEANALNDLKEQQLGSMKQELLVQQSNNGELTERLRMLESILEARKGNGLQLLSADAKWVDKENIQYNLTLVKGGNYPRYISGNIQMSAQSPESETVEIELENQKSKLPFRIETHTFLRGLAKWEQDWRPDKILVTVFNHRGKELLQTDILLEGAPQ
ncbi:MAG TPA: hypothetical protein VKA23_05055 [Mariprofundaceae bacterium]|nr:hypothetical protein [Mariprofundaceae bacterium]